MKKFPLLLLAMLILTSTGIFGQRYDSFLDGYTYYRNCRNQPSEIRNNYDEISGTPYLNEDFAEGVIYARDTVAYKLPLRLNLYADKMEYQVNGVNYAVENPQSLVKIVLGKSQFIYSPFIATGGYFELLVSGKCILLQKRIVAFRPGEGPKPIIGTATPAEFSREPDLFYIGVEHAKAIETKSLKAVLNALRDKQAQMEAFVEKEKIRNTKKDNLVKIAEYYNSL